MLMTLNFWRMCTANLLLFASATCLSRTFVRNAGAVGGVRFPDGDMFLAFIAAMFAEAVSCLSVR